MRRSLPVLRVQGDPAAVLDRDAWPAALPAVRTLLDEGLSLGPLTVLVGENGAGKSTIVEAIAMAYGMSAEGGSTGARHHTRASESPLHDALVLRRGIGASRWGFFLRAETMHGFYSYLEDNPKSDGGETVFHEMSHGESFLEILHSRFGARGLYVLDEPESALSFTGCLALVAVLRDIARSSGGQAVVATHSPIVAAVEGAEIYEVGDWGLRPSDWADLALVANWRRFLDRPAHYLRHLP